jgi:hypothetical protein
MSKLPTLTAEKLIKVLEKDGFIFIRINRERLTFLLSIHGMERDG